MQPGEKTRAPLRTGKSGEGMASRLLRLTMIFHPDRARIGASLNLGVIEPSGTLRLGAAFIGREAPLFEDGAGLGEPHVSRRALKLKHHARGLELQCVSERSLHPPGPAKNVHNVPHVYGASARPCPSLWTRSCLLAKSWR
jgi:hypothetical protein